MNIMSFDESSNEVIMLKSVLVRIITCVVCISMLTVFAPVSAAQETGSDKPSQWAEREIAEAINNDLVPEQLQSNYRSNIKRSQYVLLALKVFDAAGKSVDIKESRPFIDTLGHKYEQEIVKAYNAGIVKGDGKGNFHPDNFITREEIASLVVNLLMQITPDKDFTVKGTYTYGDSDKISEWAKYYIDFCFENKILAGYGNNVIDPKGNATIEQSIALLYRLAKNEGLIGGTEGPIRLENVGTAVANAFIAEYSAKTFDILKALAENDKVEITSFWEKSATVSLDYNTISLNSPEFEKNLFALVHNIGEELFVTAYKELMIENFKDGEKGALLLDEYIGRMKEKELIDIYEQVNETEIFVIESIQDIDGSVSYMVGYIQRKP